MSQKIQTNTWIPFLETDFFGAHIQNILKEKGSIDQSLSYNSKKLSRKKLAKAVAAHLRGLWTVAHWAEGNTRPVVNKLKTQDWKLHIHILHYFSSIVYKWYIVVTYQPCAHICNSCERYVVVTYRSIKCTSCKKHVSYTCNSGELIQIGTEQLRNKRIFIYFPYCIFILLLGAICITNLTN